MPSDRTHAITQWISFQTPVVLYTEPWQPILNKNNTTSADFHTRTSWRRVWRYQSQSQRV